MFDSISHYVRWIFQFIIHSQSKRRYVNFNLSGFDIFILYCHFCQMWKHWCYQVQCSQQVLDARYKTWSSFRQVCSTSKCLSSRRTHQSRTSRDPKRLPVELCGRSEIWTVLRLTSSSRQVPANSTHASCLQQTCSETQPIWQTTQTIITLLSRYDC